MNPVCGAMTVTSLRNYLVGNNIMVNTCKYKKIKGEKIVIIIMQQNISVHGYITLQTIKGMSLCRFGWLEKVIWRKKEEFAKTGDEYNASDRE